MNGDGRLWIEWIFMKNTDNCFPSGGISTIEGMRIGTLLARGEKHGGWQIALYPRK